MRRFASRFFIQNRFFCYFCLCFSLLSVANAEFSGPRLEDIENLRDTVHVAFLKQEIKFNFYTGISNIESQIQNALFSGLVYYDNNNQQIRNILIASWHSNESNTVYTFHLRNNAYFSDGSPITAQDVKDSWLAILQHESIFSYLLDPIAGVTDYLDGKGELEDIGIRVISKKTLQVELTRRNTEFLKIISHSVFSVTTSRQASLSNWEETPLSLPFSGPFYLAKANDSYLILKKNPQFWARDSVKAEHIVVHFYDYDDEKLVQDIRLGKIHWSTVYVDDDTVPNDWVHVNRIFGSSFLYFRTSTPPWDDPKIRTAIRLLLPLDELLTTEYQYPAFSLLPSLYGDYQAPEISQEQDVDQALELLSEAGYPRGRGLPPLILFIPTYEGNYNTLFDTIKTTIEAETMIEVEITTAETNEYYSTLSTTEYSIGITNWIGDYVSPSAFLKMWLIPRMDWGFDYYNPEYRRMYEYAVETAETHEERNTNLQDVELFLLESTVVIPLQHLYAINIVRTDLIDGWSTNILDNHPLAELHTKEVEPAPFITLLLH